MNARRSAPVWALVAGIMLALLLNGAAECDLLDPAGKTPEATAFRGRPSAPRAPEPLDGFAAHQLPFICATPGLNVPLRLQSVPSLQPPIAYAKAIAYFHPSVRAPPPRV